MRNKFLFSLLLSTIPFSSICAEEIDKKANKNSEQKPALFNFKLTNLYLGVGRGVYYHDEDGYKSSSGFQLYAGYAFSKKFFQKMSVSAELGYMDSGKLDAKPTIINNTIVTPESVSQSNAWISAVANYPVHDKWDAHARLGYDFGDSNGVIYGGGLTYQLAKRLAVMGELVDRDVLSSGQVNLVYHF